MGWTEQAWGSKAHIVADLALGRALRPYRRQEPSLPSLSRPSTMLCGLAEFKATYGDFIGAKSSTVTFALA